MHEGGTMKTILFMVCVVTISGFISAQGKAVHFKKLQEFLPSTDLPGFDRKRPSGQTQTNMGMTTSEAKVRYVTKQVEQTNDVEAAMEPEQTIEVSISDFAGIPYGQMAMMAYQGEFENETEDGYEKSISVNKIYKGKESMHTGDYKNCSLEVAVGNRFLVKIEAQNTDDVKLLHTIVNSMNLAGLEKATP